MESKSRMRRQTIQNGGYQPRRPESRRPAKNESIFDDEFDDDTFDEYDDWDEYDAPTPPRTGSHVRAPIQQSGDNLTEREVRAIVREEVLRILREYPTREEMEAAIEKMAGYESNYKEDEPKESSVEPEQASTGDPMSDAINEAFNIRSSSSAEKTAKSLQEVAKAPVKDQWKVASKELDDAEDDWDTSEALG